MAASRLVDLRRTSYEAILAFRDDEDSQAKMRRFRLFVYEQYQNKSRAFVEDDIQQRIYDYHEAAKKHGFALKEHTMSFLLHSKLFAAGLGSSVLSFAFRSPDAIIAALSGKIG